MSLPYLQSYNDPKKQKAYLRYMEGKSQREIAAKLKIPSRTVAHWSKCDEWESERQARKIAQSDAPEATNVAAVAAGTSPPLQGAATPAAESAQPESRAVGMDRMLARQQRIVGKLLRAYEADVEKTIAEAEAKGANLGRSQISQLTTLGNNLMSMERKAWCVPDKIETKDTTPSAADRTRNLTDEQLNIKLEAARVARVEAESRRGTAAARGAAPAQSVN